MTPIFFATPAAWRRWLSDHHAHTRELIVGFHKRHSGTPSITWPESVDEALCFGWIDGIRRRLDDDTYTIRFTPRRRGSTWSAVNVKRVGELIRLRRMRAAGLRAFKARTAGKTAIYSFEQRKAAVLSRAQQKLFKAQPEAWKYFRAQAPWYQRTATWWVMSAVKAETRARRLTSLIDHSLRGSPIGPLARPSRGDRPASN